MGQILLLNNVKILKSLCMTVLEVKNRSILGDEKITLKIINRFCFVLGNDTSCKNFSLRVHNHRPQAVQSNGLDLSMASWDTSSKSSCYP